MRAILLACGALTLSAALVAGQAGTVPAGPNTSLEIYVIDVEGGNAQLYRFPSGESVLIDSGNGGAGAARDAARIMAAVHDAGLTRIDHLITTHFHGDHVGGLPELASRVPIREFIDHGPNVQPGPQIDAVLAEYAKRYAAAGHRVVKPGDTLPIRGVDWRIVSAGGQVLRTPLPGAGRPNPYCAAFTKQEVNPVSGAPVGNTEDEQSVGSHVVFGRFRLLYLGDLTWNQEFELVCPANRLGTADLFVVSRHGQPSSNSQALVHAVEPRVIVMNDGPRKGGQPQAMSILLSSPRLENLWAIHASELGGQEYTVPGLFVANDTDNTPAAMPIAPVPPPARGAQAPAAATHDGASHWIKVSARTDGSFTVTNSRNGFSKFYRARS